MTELFGRVYELEIGTGTGLVRRFDGFPSADNTPLNIRFTVDQTPVAERSYSEITIYGLNRESRSAIYEQYTTVTLKAGYASYYGAIFNGSIENVEIGRDGPDSYVKLFCQSGAESWEEARISKTFGQNTPQKEIIKAVAETFGFPVEFVGDFDSLPRALKGRVLDRDSKSAMRQLANSFDFEWFVSNGQMTIVKEGAQRPAAEPYKYTPATGLIGSPQITQKGVDIDVLMNGLIRPFDLYTVESETAALTFNGIYYQRQDFPKTNGEGTNQALSLVHEGDFYGDTWKTSIEGRRISG